MRKWFWYSCGLALCAAVGFYMASVYVKRHPNSTFGRAVIGAYRLTTTENPLVRFSHDLCARTAAVVKQKMARPTRPATDADKPYVVESPEFRQACEDVVKSELPPAQQLGTVTIPECEIVLEPPCPEVEPAGGEELAEWLPMEPVEGEATAPLTMPYLGELTIFRVTRLLETNFDEGAAEDCEPPAAEPTDDVIIPVCPTPGYDHIYPHGGCTQPVVCPYSGKCYMPEPAVPHCEPEEKPMKDEKGEEPAKPMDEPQEETGATDPLCPDYHHHHDSMYHHGGHREVVCPYSGKSYPIDEEPCDPKKTDPEIADEEQQEAKPAEQPKPEKKPEMKKKRKVRHKLWLLRELDPTQRDGGDTLEFRPSDANPNEFGLIPF
jgi:hypothetical protein